MEALKLVTVPIGDARKRSAAQTHLNAFALNGYLPAFGVPIASPRGGTDAILFVLVHDDEDDDEDAHRSDDNGAATTATPAVSAEDAVALAQKAGFLPQADGDSGND